MVRNCPKCGYARKASDAKVPDWQCPSCGIAYQKYVDQPNPAPAAAPLRIHGIERGRPARVSRGCA